MYARCVQEGRDVCESIQEPGKTVFDSIERSGTHTCSNASNLQRVEVPLVSCRRGGVLSRFPVVQQQKQFVPVALARQTERESREQDLFRGRILLVDDDDDLRRLLRALLEGDGYQVFSCRDASRALKVFASRGDIDLLLTDFQMPQMSGVELCQRVAELQPDLPILILSGAILPEDARATIAANGWELIAKPCDVLVLLQIIASRLEAKRAISVVGKTEACVP